MSSPLGRRQVLGKPRPHFTPQRFPRLKNVVSDRRRRTTQYLGHLGRIQALHLAQHEGAALLRRQNSHDLAEDPVRLVAVGPRPRALAGAHQPQMVLGVRLVGPFPARPRTQKVDGEVGADPVEPGRKPVARIVTIETLPGLEEGHLNHVPGLGVVGKNPRHSPVEAAGMAPNQLSERLFIAVLRAADPVAVSHDRFVVDSDVCRQNAQVLPHHRSP